MNEPSWPPKSPAEALLSSPSGRQRFRELKEQRRQHRETSPSPIKKSINSLVENMDLFVGDGTEEEDEETLQLQLQAIQAKLKLKKLQAKKASRAGAEGETNGDRSGSSDLGRGRGSSQPSSRTGSALSSSGAGGGAAEGSRRHPEPTGKGLLRSRSVAELVSVPVSPAKRRPIPPADPQRSPGRILLGIDKGRSAADVSLRRPPRAGTVAESLRNTAAGIGARGAVGGEKVGKSFNERMAERREQEKENLMKKARSESLRQSRSTGFGVASEEVEAYKKKAGDLKVSETRSETVTRKTATFSREEIMNAARSPHKAVHKNFDKREPLVSSTSRRGSASERSESRARPGSSFLKSKSMDFGRNQGTPDEDEDRPRSRQNDDVTLFDPISSTPLSRRILPHSFLERTVKGKKNVPLTTMLRTIKAPDWELPEDVAPSDSDFVVFAIIGSKSAPLDHRGNSNTHDDKRDSTQTSTDAAAEASLNNQKKYMVFTLVSPCLRWSVDMYLFGTGYTRWRMLTPGTLIALLNPGIMPPPPGKADTNRWSLRLGSSDDTILEIGTSSELGWCKAVKKNGQRCNAWIDARTLEFCEFQIELNVERIKSTRMDAQGQGGFKRGTRGGGAGGTGRWGGGSKKEKKESVSDIKFDRFTGTNYYVASGPGNGGGGNGPARAPFFGPSTSATLLDLDENGASDRTSKAERLRKSLAQKEKERDLARELGKTGRGAGAEYMTRHGGERTDTSSDRRKGDREGDEKPLDAKEMGLHGGSAADVQLSPLKRKKSALDSIGERVGKRKKTTRFVTSKGIRVAGRESLPNVEGNGEESDDLEIV